MNRLNYINQIQATLSESPDLPDPLPEDLYVDSTFIFLTSILIFLPISLLFETGISALNLKSLTSRFS